MVRRWGSLALALAVLAIHADARAQGIAKFEPTAQTYPSRPVRVVVPFLAGGSTDAHGRLAAQMLSEELGQQFVIENVSGAGGTIGAHQVARAAPDGYALLIGTPGSITINPHIQANMPYDSLRDFAPIALIGNTAGTIIVTRQSPLAAMADLIAAAKAKPGSLTYGSAGVGSFTHFNAELFQYHAGVKLTHIPYRGSSQADVDLLGGRIDVIFGSVQSYLSMGERVRALAIAAERRSRLAPTIPTAGELGLPGYRYGSWTGLLAPAGTSPAIIEKLNAAIEQALSKPSVVRRYEQLGVEPASMSPEDFAKFIAAEFVQIGILAKVAGLKPQ